MFKKKFVVFIQRAGVELIYLTLYLGMCECVPDVSPIFKGIDKDL